MKTMKILQPRKLLRLAVFAAFMIAPVFSYADHEFGHGDPDSPESVPIDGGLSLLIAAGVGYGVKKAYRAKKRK